MKKQVRIRAQLCQALGLDESAMPFAGELIQLRELMPEVIFLPRMWAGLSRS